MAVRKTAWKLRTSVLEYHSVNDALNRDLSVTRENFERQMAYLKNRGYKSVTIEELYKLTKDKEYRPENKYVVITFDDGYEDNYTNAFPILQEYDFKATIFLTTGNILTDVNSKTDFFWLSDLPNETYMLSWNQIKKMYDYGISFGAHTVSHPYLPSLSIQEIREEIIRSKTEIEIQLNCKVFSFSYPFGTTDDRINDVLREEGFKIICSENPESIFEDQVMTYGRIYVNRADNLMHFRLKLSKYYKYLRWLKVRQLAALIR